MIIYTDNYEIVNTFSDYKVTKNFFNKVYVYLIKDEIVGYIDYSVMYERAEINYIFVKKDYRKQYIATKLIEFMLDNIDVEGITLEVNCENNSAINLYKKFHFREVSIRKGYYKGIDGILMKKEVH